MTEMIKFNLDPKPFDHDLEIRRSEWNRGGKSETKLLNENGMCCLGFCAMQVGKFPEDEIEGKLLPSDLSYALYDDFVFFCQEHNAFLPKPSYLPQWEDFFAFVNDAELSLDSPTSKERQRYTELGSVGIVPKSEEHREEILTHLFNEIGIRVTFVD